MKFFKWLRDLFFYEMYSVPPPKQPAFASERRCYPHPYERLIICNNCQAENCPCDNICHFCRKSMPDLNDSITASFTPEEEDKWDYNEEVGWIFNGEPLGRR